MIKPLIGTDPEQVPVNGYLGRMAYQDPNSVKIGGGEITVTTLTTTGDITAGGDINTLSDERLKYDINAINDALEKVLSLQGVSYKLKSSAQTHIGLIAQQTQKVIPEVVHSHDYLSISYGNLVALLIEAIKELNTKVEQLRSNQGENS